MALKEKISKHLGVKYLYLPDKKLFLCENGVLFSLEEYRKGIDLQTEYERRKNENTLYDFAYAKSTGLLRKKRGYKKAEEVSERNAENELTTGDEDRAKNTTERLSSGSTEEHSRLYAETQTDEGSNIDRRNESSSDRPEEEQGNSGLKSSTGDRRAVTFIALLLTFTSLISGYISTLHTATYLFDYVDVFSAWLMSASVTAYNATAFEVAVIFKKSRRFSLAFIFIMLWAMVTLFSMATTVSVFYDRFNFTETQIAEENRQSDANKLALELLKTKEKDLREAIDFKKQDIQYRQDRDYATTAVRLELEALQKELQENLSEQQKVLSETPEITEKVTKRKESLFAFLGRILHIDGGILEFTMSTLSAIFVNIVCPFSVIAVTEIKKKRVD